MVEVIFSSALAQENTNIIVSGKNVILSEKILDI